MAKPDTTIVAEFDSPTNASYMFVPLQKVVRGKFDLHRVKEPQAGRLHSKWPEPIPGQRIEYDYATGEGAVVDPLHEERFAAIRERIEDMGQRLPAAREAFKLDAATFHYWLSGLVEIGDAKVLQGKLPDCVSGKPRTRFRSSESRDPIDRLSDTLAAAMERQAEQHNKVMEMLVAALERFAK